MQPGDGHVGRRGAHRRGRRAGTHPAAAVARAAAVAHRKGGFERGGGSRAAHPRGCCAATRRWRPSRRGCDSGAASASGLRAPSAWSAARAPSTPPRSSPRICSASRPLATTLPDGRRARAARADEAAARATVDEAARAARGTRARRRRAAVAADTLSARFDSLEAKPWWIDPRGRGTCSPRRGGKRSEARARGRRARARAASSAPRAAREGGNIDARACECSVEQEGRRAASPSPPPQGVEPCSPRCLHDSASGRARRAAGRRPRRRRRDRGARRRRARVARGARRERGRGRLAVDCRSAPGTRRRALASLSLLPRASSARARPPSLHRRGAAPRRRQRWRAAAREAAAAGAARAAARVAARGVSAPRRARARSRARRSPLRGLGSARRSARRSACRDGAVGHNAAARASRCLEFDHAPAAGRLWGARLKVAGVSSSAYRLRAETAATTYRVLYPCSVEPQNGGQRRRRGRPHDTLDVTDTGSATTKADDASDLRPDAETLEFVAGLPFSVSRLRNLDSAKFPARFLAVPERRRRISMTMMNMVKNQLLEARRRSCPCGPCCRGCPSAVVESVLSVLICANPC